MALSIDANDDVMLRGILELDVLEDAADLTGADEAVASVLKQHSDLKRALRESDAACDQARDEFVDTLCLEVDDMVRLHAALEECETQLTEFEADIVRHREDLTNTSEEIAAMRDRTVGVIHRVDNRKAVAQRLKEVYEALNECDKFCGEIAASSSVDAEFLKSIHKLEAQLAFLADNAELEDSAVHADFKPKLEAAALKAGDKLYRYLLKKLDGLAEDNTNVALQQQGIERAGGYALTFLSRYNAGVAQALIDHYVGLMADVYVKQSKQPLRELTEISFVVRCDPAVHSMIPADLVAALRGAPRRHNSVSGTPTASAARMAGSMAGSFAASLPGSQQRPTRSISASFGLAFDRIRGKTVDRRTATFADNIAALRAINVRYRLVAVDPVVSRQLSQTTCWVNVVTELLCRLVNNVISEVRFVGHFFFANTSNGTERQEHMLRAILTKMLQTAAASLAAETPAVGETLTVLCAVRAFEVFKNYVTLSADPLPLMIMSTCFEEMGGVLQARLRELLEGHVLALTHAASGPAFPSHPALSTEARRLRLSDVVSHDEVVASTLVCPDAIRRYADMAAELHYANSVRLEGSRVNVGDTGAERIVCDDRTATTLLRCQTLALSLVDQLSARHTSPLSASVFTVNCIGRMLFQWEGAAAAATGETEGDTTDTTAPMMELPGYPDLVHAFDQAVQRFVHFDVTAIPGVAAFVDLVERMEATLGSEFFAAAASPAPATFDFSDNEILQALTVFSDSWREGLSQIDRAVKVYFHSEGSESLIAAVRHAYFNLLEEANSKMRQVATSVFPSASQIQAKIVSRQTFSHEVARYVRQEAPSP